MAKTSKTKSKSKSKAKPKSRGRMTEAVKKRNESLARGRATAAANRAARKSGGGGGGGGNGGGGGGGGGGAVSEAVQMEVAVSAGAEAALEIAKDAPTAATAQAIMSAAPAIAQQAVEAAKEARKRGRPPLLRPEERSLPVEEQERIKQERRDAAAASRALKSAGQSEQAARAAANVVADVVQEARKRGRPSNAEREARMAASLASIPGFKFDVASAFTGFEAGATGNRRTMTRYRGGTSIQNAKSAIQYCVDDAEGGCMNEPEIRNEMAYTMAEGSLTSDPKMMALRAGEVLWLERSRKHAEARRARSTPLRSMPITRTVEGSKTMEEVDALMKSILAGRTR